MQLLLILIPVKILALIIGLYYFRNLSTPYRLLAIQVFFSIASESLGYYLGTVKHQNNIWVFYYYLLIDCWLVGLAGRHFIANPIFRKSIPFVLFALSLVWLTDLLTADLNTFSNKFFIAYSILFVLIFISALTNRAFINDSIFKSAVFWVAVSSILYYGCIIPYMGLLNYLLQNAPKLADSLFDIILSLNFIRYPLVALAFYLHGKQRQTNLKAA